MVLSLQVNEPPRHNFYISFFHYITVTMLLERRFCHLLTAWITPIYNIKKSFQYTLALQDISIFSSDDDLHQNYFTTTSSVLIDVYILVPLSINNSTMLKSQKLQPAFSQSSLCSQSSHSVSSYTSGTPKTLQTTAFRLVWITWD